MIHVHSKIYMNYIINMLLDLEHVTQWIECLIPILTVEGSNPSMLILYLIVAFHLIIVIYILFYDLS